MNATNIGITRQDFGIGGGSIYPLGNLSPSIPSVHLHVTTNTMKTTGITIQLQNLHGSKEVCRISNRCLPREKTHSLAASPRAAPGDAPDSAGSSPCPALCVPTVHVGTSSQPVNEAFSSKPATKPRHACPVDVSASIPMRPSLRQHFHFRQQLSVLAQAKLGEVSG